MTDPIQTITDPEHQTCNDWSREEGSLLKDGEVCFTCEHYRPDESCSMWVY